MAFAIYFSNTVKGIIQGIFWGSVFIWPVYLVFSIIARTIKSALVLKITYSSIFVCCLILIGLWHWYYLSPPSDILFKRVMYIEPPSSARNFRSIVEYPGKDMHFRFKFTIDSIDLYLIMDKFSITRRTQFTYFPESNRWKYDSLDAFYLKSCVSCEWWNLDKLLKLPTYRYDDDRFLRNLWKEEGNEDGEYVIYLSGIAP